MGKSKIKSASVFHAAVNGALNSMITKFEDPEGAVDVLPRRGDPEEQQCADEGDEVASELQDKMYIEKRVDEHVVMVYREAEEQMGSNKRESADEFVQGSSKQVS